MRKVCYFSPVLIIFHSFLSCLIGFSFVLFKCCFKIAIHFLVKITLTVCFINHKSIRYLHNKKWKKSMVEKIYLVIPKIFKINEKHSCQFFTACWCHLLVNIVNISILPLYRTSSNNFSFLFWLLWCAWSNIVLFSK